jgi:hypothetical protein
MGDARFFARIPASAMRCRELTACDWRVLTCVALHANSAGKAWPSMATIASSTGIRREDVPRSIRRLEKFGLLRTTSGGGSSSNSYVLAFDGNVVSASKRTGVSDAADTVSAAVQAGCPQICTSSVRTDADQTNKNRPINRVTSGRPFDARLSLDKSANDDFEQFWQLYPHRGRHPDPKKPAREKFEAAVKRGVDRALIIRAARNYAESMRLSGTRGQFIKTAEVWLNKASWEQYGADQEPDLPVAAGMI